MSVDSQDSAVFASLESLVQDQYQARLLDAMQEKKTHQSGHGNVRSGFKGRGMDFEEVRQYQDGDDVRLVDWRLTAKVGKVYTKVFNEEHERNIYFLLDLRSGMKFATKQAFKSVICAHIMGMLAWYFWQKSDKIGGIVLGEKEVTEFKPSRLRKKVMSFFNCVGDNTKQESVDETQNKNSLTDACLKLRHSCRNGNIIFVISDFCDVDADSLKCFASLARTNEVIFINVYDVLESRCPVPNVYVVSDGHEHFVLDTRQQQVQDTYVHHFFKRLLILRDFTLKYHIKYIPVSSDMNYYQVVAKMMRKQIWR